MSDPLAGALQHLARELAGGATDPAPQASDQECAPVTYEVDEELLDEPFQARVERGGRYRRATQSEAGLAEEVLTELNARPGVFARKVHQGPTEGSGEPDLDICVYGRCVKIELKAPGGSSKKAPTPKQHRRLLQWQEADALVGWATSMNQVDEILARLDDPTYRYDGQAGAPAPVAPPAPED